MLKRKRHINEKFVEDSDPIKDLGIDTMSKIKKFVKAAHGDITESIDLSTMYLFVCAQHDKVEWVKFLIAKGADVKYHDSLALRWAVYNNNPETVKILLDAGADVHADNEWPLSISVRNRYTEIVKILLDAGANVHASDDWALRSAAENGHAETVKVLLDAGADIHAGGNCALRQAAKYGRTETVKVLLDAGADVHAKNDQALRWAAEKGHTEIVKILQDHIAKENKAKKVKESLNEKFVEDSDPVEDLGIGTRKKISKFMKELGEEDTDDNALGECAAAGKTEWVKFLLARGADASAYDYWSLRAASGRGYTDIVKLLIEHGVDLNDERARVSFVWAAEEGNADVIQVFLDTGINLNTKHYFYTLKQFAIEIASANGHNNVIKLINDYDNKQNNANNMKAKKVRESLNEKFVEDSDPIEDLKIGLYKYLDILLQKVPWLKYVHPEQKDIDRIKSLVNKSKGDSSKEEMYARNMAKAITDLDKSYRRFKAAEKHGGNGWAVTKIFLQRVLELYGVL